MTGRVGAVALWDSGSSSAKLTSHTCVVRRSAEMCAKRPALGPALSTCSVDAGGFGHGGVGDGDGPGTFCGFF